MSAIYLIVCLYVFLLNPIAPFFYILIHIITIDKILKIIYFIHDKTKNQKFIFNTKGSKDKQIK